MKFNVEGRRTAKCGYLHHFKDDFFMLIFFSRWILEICLKNIGNCVYCMRTWGYSTTCFVCFGYIKNKRLFLLKMILLWNKYSRHWSFLFHRKYINLWSAPIFFQVQEKEAQLETKTRTDDFQTCDRSWQVNWIRHLQKRQRKIMIPLYLFSDIEVMQIVLFA